MPNVRGSAGFTLTEMTVVLAIFMVMTAGAMALLSSAEPTIRANGQVNRVLSMMQRGREAAITRQRMHVVRVDEDAETIELLRLEDEVEVPVETIALEYGMQVHIFSGSPDTPDGYGNEAAADFGGATAVMFDSEGSFVDASGVPCSGTIYLGNPSDPSTARAVTLTGSTGRARFYVWNGNQEWEGGWLAK